MNLDGDSLGFFEVNVDKEGLDSAFGRRWIWSDSRLSIGLIGGTTWRGEWDIGAGLRYEF